MLRSLAIEYPRAHDVSDALQSNVDKLPKNIAKNLEELSSLISELASIRGPAFYGYEREGIPASEAFKLKYAQEVYGKVEKYLKLISRLLEEKLFL